MRILVTVLFVAGLCLPVVAGDVTQKNWKRIRKHVLPDRADQLWRNVPWRATFWDAVIDAQRQDKPILLWAMNGHALACT